MNYICIIINNNYQYNSKKSHINLHLKTENNKIKENHIKLKIHVNSA